MTATTANKTVAAALRIVAIYTVFSLLWISLSEKVVGWCTRDPSLIMRIDVFKGYTFILLTAILLYVLILRHTLALKKAEEFLRQSEQRFKSIFDLAAVGVALVEPQSGRFRQLNSKFCDITGFSEPEMLDRRFQDITHPDDVPDDQECLLRLYRGEIGSYTREKRYIRRDGSLVWVNLTVSPSWQGEEERRYHIAVAEDITRRRDTEQALRDADERLGLALAASKMGVWEWSVPDDRVFWSPECLEILGADGFDGTLACFLKRLHPEDTERVLAAAHLALAQGTLYGLEYRIVRPDGELRWLSDLARPVYDAGGKPLRLTGTVQDITERKVAENALRENRELLLAVVNGAEDAIFLKDCAGKFLMANPATLRILGKTSDELVGKSSAEIHPPQLAAAIKENDCRVLETGQTEVFEETVQGSSGRRTFISSKSARRDAEGRIIGLISVSHDISRRKEFEEQQRATIELLRLCNVARNTKELLRELLHFFQEVSGCEAVGVRLQNGYDFPYYESRGFPESFLLAENSLCARDPNGRVILDGAGCPTLDCMCGNVLCGCFDPCQPFFTERGSFWSNSTSELLAGSPEAERGASIRNRCNGEGYQSVALIMIRFQGERLGLVQFNDRRPGRFTAEKIAQLEELVDSLSIALAKHKGDEALSRSERSLLEAQRVAGLGSFVYDVPADRWSATLILEEILGVDARFERTRSGWVALLHPSQRAGVLAHLEEAMAGGHPFDREHLIVRAEDRQERWLHTLARLEYGPDGAPARIIGTSQDITARKRGEREKDELEAQLQQAQKMESVGRLAGGVAHDFNNMLSVILGHAGLAEMQLEPTQPLHSHLEEIRKAAERSASLTRQLLAFARKQAIAPEVLDLNLGVSGMLTMLMRLIGEEVRLDWQPGAELWPVRMDPSQVDQILANLCVNARDAIAGIGTITIRTQNRPVDATFCARHPGLLPGEYVLLEVSDNGCGMDRETVGHIFEPFFTTKEKGSGTGLGLSSVYGAVQQNGGCIDAVSEPGQGTSFSIYLPREAEQGAPGLAAAIPKASPRGKETILLVEDEPAILQMAALALTGQGYTVLSADTPEEGISWAEGHPGEISLLVTDVIMPQMNGLDLARAVGKVCPGLKCLFMSGYTADIIGHHGVLEHGVHFLHKPFSLSDLASKVRQVLDGG